MVRRLTTEGGRILLNLDFLKADFEGREVTGRVAGRVLTCYQGVSTLFPRILGLRLAREKTGRAAFITG